MNFSLVDGTFEIDKPEMILYDGTSDDARVVGLSYYIVHPGSAEPTQGFTGNNDHYHRHDGLCVGPGGVIGDSTTNQIDRRRTIWHTRGRCTMAVRWMRKKHRGSSRHSSFPIEPRSSHELAPACTRTPFETARIQSVLSTGTRTTRPLVRTTQRRR